MKMKLVAFVALALGVAASVSYAGWWNHMGADANLENVKKFQKETSTLRDEMVIKRIELQQENAKTNPDQARVATLEKEMGEIRTKIQASADKNGIAAGMTGGKGMCRPGMGDGAHGKGGMKGMCQPGQGGGKMMCQPGQGGGMCNCPNK